MPRAVEDAPSVPDPERKPAGGQSSNIAHAPSGGSSAKRSPVSTDRSIDAEPLPATIIATSSRHATHSQHHEAEAALDAAAIGEKATYKLLAAFLEGAGIPAVHITGGLTPQLMHVLGKLFRENTRGTMDLLAARAAAKQQLRIGVTVIVARENNPLKFSPNVESAMTHLLAPHGPGFMTPTSAVRNAYNDLRSHEVGFLAGMRAALAGVLNRFSPQELEKRLTHKTVLDSLVPLNRDAKLWALFEELYAQISSEAEDNFHELFGREFMRAYEEQIARLETEDRAPKVRTDG
jgi:FHA domain-containing protein